MPMDALEVTPSIGKTTTLRHLVTFDIACVTCQGMWSVEAPQPAAKGHCTNYA